MHGHAQHDTFLPLCCMMEANKSCIYRLTNRICTTSQLCNNQIVSGKVIDYYGYDISQLIDVVCQRRLEKCRHVSAYTHQYFCRLVHRGDRGVTCHLPFLPGIIIIIVVFSIIFTPGSTAQCSTHTLPYQLWIMFCVRLVKE